MVRPAPTRPKGADTVPDIVPRWEWRTFGRRFGVAESRLAGLAPIGVQDSDEVYVLAKGRDNVKVRGGLLDIKALREVSPDGLERWEPVMKAGFPLGRAEVTRVCESLGLPLPPLPRDAYDLEQFLGELVLPSGALRVARVHKRRVRYTVGGCAAEVSDITADGRKTRTIAIESEDPAAVTAAVQSMGLAGFLNTSYPRGLQALLDDAPDRYAVIDVGTNSVKLHVAERRGGGFVTLVDRAEITRLGERLQECGEITDAARDRTAEAIAGMADEARRSGVLAIAAVGTAGLRVARNAAGVLAAVLARTGVSIEVISGEEESRLAYRAVEAGLGLAGEALVVFDTGGGSSQFTFGHGARVDERFSVEVGAARYTERFGLGGAVSHEQLAEALAAIAADLSRLDARPAPRALVGMGGAATNLAAVKHGLAAYDPEVVQGTVLERTEIDRQVELYRTRDAAARRTIVGLQPKRAEVILAGACIVRTIMDKLGQTRMTVSDRGLRHGVLAERFGG
jgi:exopolyphosphatase/guanosine-5'-triphosphate,3'-diphosphate pyrophosphatase